MSPEMEAIVQQSLDLIEEHLQTVITPDWLSRQAGFSLYHYCRVFKAATGMSVMRYITRRRLLHAAYRITLGQEMTETALAYGFDSYAGFYKAFRREFGASPTEHLRTHQAACPARVNLKERGNMMERKQTEAVLANWNLTGAAVDTVCYPNTGGLSSNTFLIDGRYYLKCSGSPGSIPRQAQLLRALHAEGLAAEVIPTVDGHDTARVGEWECLLTRRLEGQPLRAVDALRGPDAGRAIGEGLARLHEALLTMDPLLCTEESLPETLRGWAVPKLREAMGQEAHWLGKWLDRFEAQYAGLPVQIIHRDPNPDNLMMADGRLAGFADFELSRIAPRIFDLAYAATGVLSVTFDRVKPEERLAFFALARAVWQGYHARSPLSEAERQALPDMVIAIQLICLAAFTGTDAYAHQAEVNRQMLEMILANESLLRQPLL